MADEARPMGQTPPRVPVLAHIFRRSADTAGMKTLRLGVLSCALGLLAGCGYREIDPPKAPAKEMPAVEARRSPPEPGTTRMVLDANGERAKVVEVVARETGTARSGRYVAVAYGETTRPVCVTPCVVDLKPGMHELRFRSRSHPERVSLLDLQVTDSSKVVRHSIGRHEPGGGPYVASLMLVILGSSAALLGGLLYGLASTMPSDDDINRNVTTGGAVTGLAGAGALAVGIPLMFLTQPVAQEGSTTTFPLGSF